MAGGIDWFRWHHGSVTDPKFGLVARKAKARLGDVIAVWAFILEHASANVDRGTIGETDFEAIDFLLGMEDGDAARIIEAMADRGLIDGNLITSWDKRQPKREDETAADRKRRQRQREHESAMSQSSSDSPVTDNMSRDVTQSHGDVTHGHDRGEERRVDKEPSGSLVAPFGAAKPKRASALPEDFAPNDTAHALAESLGVSLPVELAKFKDHFALTGKVGKDWQAGFRNWLKRASEYRGSQPRGSPPFGREESRRIAAGTRLSDFRAACAADQQGIPDDGNSIEGGFTRLVG